MSNWKEVVGDLYIKDRPVVNSKFQKKIHFRSIKSNRLKP
jgi:hypothetical protein